MAKKVTSRLCPCQGGTLVRFLQPAILAILSEKPYHGYMILQKLGRTLLWREEAPDPAGVYRALRDMEKRGLISAQMEAGSDRKVFRLTEDGVRCRASWLKTLRQYQLGLDEMIAALAACEGGAPRKPGGA